MSGAIEGYHGFTLNITSAHPFAKLALEMAGGARTEASLFPAIVVATESDDKPAALSALSDVFGVALTAEDVDPLEARGYMMMTPEKLAAIREAAQARGRIYGVSTIIRRTDRIAIEIWAENIQLKNELYELVRLFVCGWMKHALEKLYAENGLAIFDNTVHGERSNNFNVDFGVDLAGALLVFDADYLIEQTIIDTDLTSENIDMMEVINHVKGQAGESRSVVFDCAGCGTGGDDGGTGGDDGEPGSGGGQALQAQGAGVETVRHDG